MRTPLQVTTPAGTYAITIRSGLFERGTPILPDLAGVEKTAILIDASVNAASEIAAAAAELFPSPVLLEPVPSGEQSKSVDGAMKIWRTLAERNFHRGDLLVAIGGGVTTDLGGFTAATYHRGMRWIAVPTTLLGMVDASIGGKTAIDIPEGKNLVGAFHQPIAVLADVVQLKTLPRPGFVTGMAEVVKHGLIDDLSLLERLKRDSARIDARDPGALEELVEQAAAVKVRVVNEDETERGARAFLNYGHTLGHALEALGEYQRWTHGQAISIGMMFVAHLAPLLGLADRVADHRAALEAQGLPTSGAHFSYEEVSRMFARDKKYEAGMRFVVLEDLGKPRIVRDVPVDALRAAYEKVR